MLVCCLLVPSFNTTKDTKNIVLRLPKEQHDSSRERLEIIVAIQLCVRVIFYVAENLLVCGI